MLDEITCALLPLTLAAQTPSAIGNEIICLSVYLCRNTMDRGITVVGVQSLAGGSFHTLLSFFSHSC